VKSGSHRISDFLKRITSRQRISRREWHAKKQLCPDILTGTVKGPGELPHEYLFVTADNGGARIGRVCDITLKRDGADERHILGKYYGAQRNFRRFVGPEHAAVTFPSLIGLSSDCGELYEQYGRE